MSITKPQGFLAAGMNVGIKSQVKSQVKSGELDLALVAVQDVENSNVENSTQKIVASAVFTSNRVQAAPVIISTKHLEQSRQIKAIILNSGCANAATGAAGVADAIAMCEGVAKELGVSAEEVLVCSTGLIGYGLPIEKILSGIPSLVQGLNLDGAQAAKAIMTTDTKPKEHFELGDGFVVGGMAKGAAMLAPNMQSPKSATSPKSAAGPKSATMLAVITTDASCENAEVNFDKILQTAVDASFNKLSVDGVQSTNDTVILLSNGRAGEKPVDEILAGVQKTCEALAYMMADDAEGATKTIRLHIGGASDEAAADFVGRYLADSLLLKCSWFGGDPYWGRLVSEIGATGAEFDMSKLSLSYGEHVVFESGAEVEISDSTKELADYMSGSHLDIYIELGAGNAEANILTTDLGHGYIDENSKTS